MKNLLIDLVAYLRTVDPSKFDLNSWLKLDSQGGIIKGCPLSYGCLVPSWVAKGISLAVAKDGPFPFYKGEFGGNAIASFLGKPYQWVREVFYPDMYEELSGKPALEAVIARLQKEIDNVPHGND